MIQTTEDEDTVVDDDLPMTLAEFQDSIRRVLGEALRELFQELTVYEQPLRHMGELIAGSDIRYPLPNPNDHALTGGFSPDLTLHTEQGTTSVAELMQAARPILLDLAGRADFCEAARGWEDRIEIHSAHTADRPADALLIRPDAHVAWAATVDEPADAALPALRDAIGSWFGTPHADLTGSAVANACRGQELGYSQR
jgi:hypothetical protein